MAWGLWKTLLHPDKEELLNNEKTSIARAANYLQVGEFQLLQLAYREWHGKDLPVSQVDKLFQAYMIDDIVPQWARHYSRQILKLAENDRLNDQEPQYHRYDQSYNTQEVGRFGKFVFAVSCIALFIGGGILLAHATTRQSASPFPPYFEKKDFPADKAARAGFGRADSVRVIPLP